MMKACKRSPRRHSGARQSANPKSILTVARDFIWRRSGYGFRVRRFAPPRNDGRKHQGSVANLIRPVSWSVLTSKVRISVAPPISSVTTMRSPATAVAMTRAGFRQRDDRFGRRGANTAGVENAVADDADHGGDRNQRREPRYDHHQPHARGEARRGGIGLGRRRVAAIGARPPAIRLAVQRQLIWPFG